MTLLRCMQSVGELLRPFSLPVYWDLQVWREFSKVCNSGVQFWKAIVIGYKSLAAILTTFPSLEITKSKFLSFLYFMSLL